MTEPDKPIEGVPGKPPVSEPGLPQTGPGALEEEHPAKTFDIEKGTKTAGTEGPTPMEVAGQAGAPQSVTPEALGQQSNQLQAKSQALTQALDEQTYAKLSDGQKSLLMTKANQYAQQMGHISTMTGGKFAPEELKAGTNPDLKKIIGWFNDATKTLQEGGGINEVAKDGKMSISDMMRVQARLNAADRAINFATAVVGKFSDALKQLGQTQI